ncbi:hypothetical protein CVT26_007731 [Gymnopilus dilepis]|uniref:Uncharacterized protein n=1 Tax=Gymnopilus dilepis TaxID=231916 RepID=A0A409VZZ3_9AGAR|nr:hypothetical protein CVT26_007731 [Gymnopilus dilepis]
MAPVIEFASWIPSEAYLANPSLINPVLEFLEGCKGCQQYATLSTFLQLSCDYLMAVPSLDWQSYEHHKAVMDSQDSDIKRLESLIEGDFRMFHTTKFDDFIFHHLPKRSETTFTCILEMCLQDEKASDNFLMAAAYVVEQFGFAHRYHLLPQFQWGKTLEDDKTYLSIDYSDTEYNSLAGTVFGGAVPYKIYAIKLLKHF